MYKTLTPLLLAFIMATSCGPDHEGEKKTSLASQFLSITDNEDKGIKEVIGFYGGECEYGFAKSTGIGSESEDIFWMELRNSESINNSRINREQIGSNIAYLFYRNLGQEKKNYTGIRVSTFRADGEEREFTYPVSQLEHVSKSQEILEKVFLTIKEKDYNRLGEYLSIDTALSSVNQEGLINNIREVETKIGTIQRLVPYGFRFTRHSSGRKLLFLTSMVVREGDATPLTVAMNADTTDNKIVLLDYNFIPGAREVSDN